MDFKGFYLNRLHNNLSDEFQIQCIMGDTSENENEGDRNFEIQNNQNEILYNQIKKLEREKGEIERTREQEKLEQKLKDLKGTVSALKGGSSGHSSPKSGSGSGRKSRTDSSPINISKLKNKLDTSLRSEQEESDSNDSDKSSEEEEEKEEVMSTHHKQMIQKHRDTLVENMIPDDIFNDLIAGKILTTADVSRIKKKATRESINEELLNNLVLKSDRAFYVFIKSLRKTLQECLVNLLEPPSKKKKKRKRQQREMNVSLDIDEVIPMNKKSPTCTCQEVEEQILFMSKNAYKNIRRRDDSASAFEQWRKELAQTNTVIKDAMEIMNTLKILCRHGDITGVSRGSVKFTLHIFSVHTLKKLWSLFISGELLSKLQSCLVTSELTQYFNVKDIKLGLRISEEEYQTCLKEFSTVYRSKKKEEVTMQVQDCPSLDIENSPSPKTFHVHQRGPRRAFNEIQES